MKKIFLIFILSALSSYSQVQPTVKPYPGSVELSWILDNTGATAEYLIFYCQSNDSTQIPIHDGSQYADVWDWCIGSSLYNYFFVKIKTNVLPEPSYVRLGVIALGWDGTFSDMKVIPKVLKVKRAPTPGAVKVNSTNIQP